MDDDYDESVGGGAVAGALYTVVCFPVHTKGDDGGEGCCVACMVPDLGSQPLTIRVEVLLDGARVVEAGLMDPGMMDTRGGGGRSNNRASPAQEALRTTSRPQVPAFSSAPLAYFGEAPALPSPRLSSLAPEPEPGDAASEYGSGDEGLSNAE
jgi:hypothetical protein